MPNTAPPVRLRRGRGRRTLTFFQTAAPLFLALLLLFCVYLPTLQSQINGSPDPYAEDVAEIQTALNLGGTLHATGYPLYSMLGAAFVAFVKALGIGPALAPSLFSVLWCFIALTILYILIVKLTGRTGVAAVCVGLLGLTRGVWAYSVVAKPYTMTLAFCALLLLLALWPGVEPRRRVWLLALAGGFAVAHHRMAAFMAPGLLLAALPPLFRDRRRIIPAFALAVPLALVGFLPYLYLPIRANAGGLYVYGSPNTVQGFLDEFTAKEANYLWRLPATIEDWTRDARDTLDLLFSQLTPAGVLVGVTALALIFTRRRLGRTAALCGFGFIVFLLIYHRVVMPSAVMVPVVMLTLFLIALMFNDLLTAYAEAKVWSVTLPTLTIISIAGLIAWNFSAVYAITHDESSVRLIALAQKIPRDGVLMLPWSTSYNALAFSKYVTGENAGLALVDHRADLRAISSPIYTLRDTFYRFPLEWWDAQLGRAYLASPVYSVVAIRREPQAVNDEVLKSVVDGVNLHSYRVTCDAEAAYLEVVWSTTQPTEKAYSVFVHLSTEAAEALLPNGDVSAPLYGWYPVTRWSVRERITDQYRVPLRRDATTLDFGLYEQPTPGQFVNYPAFTVPLADYGCPVR